MAFCLVAVLSGTDELDRVLALAQFLNQTRKGQCNAIDLRWPSFGHHRNAQRGVGGHKVFDQKGRVV